MDNNKRKPSVQKPIRSKVASSAVPGNTKDYKFLPMNYPDVVLGDGNKSVERIGSMRGNLVYFSDRFEREDKITFEIERVDLGSVAEHSFTFGFTCSDEEIRNSDAARLNTSCKPTLNCDGRSCKMEIKRLKTVGDTVTFKRSRKGFIIFHCNDEPINPMLFKLDGTEEKQQLQNCDLWPFVKLNGNVSSIKIVQLIDGEFSSPASLSNKVVSATKATTKGYTFLTMKYPNILLRNGNRSAIRINSMQYDYVNVVLRNDYGSAIRIDYMQDNYVYISDSFQRGDKITIEFGSVDLDIDAEHIFTLGFTTCSAEQIRNSETTHLTMNCNPSLGCEGRSGNMKIQSKHTVGNRVTFERSRKGFITFHCKPQNIPMPFLLDGKETHKLEECDLWPFAQLNGTVSSIKIVEIINAVTGGTDTVNTISDTTHAISSQYSAGDCINETSENKFLQLQESYPHIMVKSEGKVAERKISLGKNLVYMLKKLELGDKIAFEVEKVQTGEFRCSFTFGVTTCSPDQVKLHANDHVQEHCTSRSECRGNNSRVYIYNASKIGIKITFERRICGSIFFRLNGGKVNEMKFFVPTGSKSSFEFNTAVIWPFIQFNGSVLQIKILDKSLAPIPNSILNNTSSARPTVPRGTKKIPTSYSNTIADETLAAAIPSIEAEIAAESEAKIADANENIAAVLASALEIIENSKCGICLDSEVCCVTLPCGHNKTCYECGLNWFEIDGNCSFCRTPITQVVKTYN